MIYLAGLFLLLALILFWQSGRQRKAAGIPGGRIVYSDTHAWGKPLAEPLYSQELGLTGKPDYLVEQKGHLIPVEVKSSRAPEAPYDSHIYQLAAYCMLVDHVRGVRPPYGLLHYTGGASGPTRTFAVDYTSALEQSLHAMMDEMRTQGRNAPGRSHEESFRCSRCGYRNSCEDRIK